jgi:hypothetical protein
MLLHSLHIAWEYLGSVQLGTGNLALDRHNNPCSRAGETTTTRLKHAHRGPPVDTRRAHTCTARGVGYRSASELPGGGSRTSTALRANSPRTPVSNHYTIRVVGVKSGCGPHPPTPSPIRMGEGGPDGARYVPLRPRTGGGAGRCGASALARGRGSQARRRAPLRPAVRPRERRRFCPHPGTSGAGDAAHASSPPSVPGRGGASALASRRTGGRALRCAPLRPLARPRALRHASLPSPADGRGRRALRCAPLRPLSRGRERGLGVRAAGASPLRHRRRGRRRGSAAGERTGSPPGGTS